MKNKMIISVLACFFSSGSIAQVIFEPIQVNNYFTTYNPNEIIKNNVSSLTLSYCNTSLNRITHDTVKLYKKYFDLNGDEIKIIEFKEKTEEIQNIDTFILTNGNKYKDQYTIKSKNCFRIKKIYLDISDEQKTKVAQNELKKFKENGVKSIIFRDSGLSEFHRYEFQKKKLKFIYAEDNDSMFNTSFMKIFNVNRNEIDSIYYFYDYKRFSGKSIVTINSIKYLHSTVVLNKDFKIEQENIFDVEYNKLDIKLANLLQPSTSIIYYYNPNGLIKFVEFLLLENKKNICFFSYEYFK
ncbi:MAG TPA: hypothetical protein PK431_16280 [Chitinophagales bacterium]|nr:hypothetical protein [Chitinophagales bacterium]